MANSITENKNKIVNLAIIILAIIVAFNIYNKLGQDIESLKQKEELEIKKNKVLENIKQLESKIESYKYLLPTKDPSVVMGILSTLAKESGVNILSVKPGTGERKADYIKLPFDLIISADNYHTLGKFISSIENSHDVYQVEVIEIKSEGEKNILTVNLKVDAIIFVE